MKLREQSNETKTKAQEVRMQWEALTPVERNHYREQNRLLNLHGPKGRKLNKGDK